MIRRSSRSKKARRVMVQAALHLQSTSKDDGFTMAELQDAAGVSVGQRYRFLSEGKTFGAIVELEGHYHSPRYRLDRAAALSVWGLDENDLDKPLTSGRGPLLVGSTSLGGPTSRWVSTYEGSDLSEKDRNDLGTLASKLNDAQLAAVVSVVSLELATRTLNASNSESGTQASKEKEGVQTCAQTPLKAKPSTKRKTRKPPDLRRKN